MKNWRINFVFLLFISLSATVIGRLVFLQIMKGDYYLALSQGLHASVVQDNEKRGEIFLKNGEPLAINRDWFLVFANPSEIADINKTASLLADALSIDKDALSEKLDNDSFYSILKKRLEEQEINKINELNLAGIYLTREKGRYYPQEDLACQIVGFLGAEGQGQYGLEQYYEDVLEKKSIFLKEVSSDLKLTIDYDIQFQAEKELERAKEELNIEGGQIIVLEPSSGKILAMADLFGFDPNNYSEYAKEGNLQVFRNRATQELFEPGSVFKPIIMAAALEEEVITPQKTYSDPGVLFIDGYPVYNYDKRTYPGLQTMTNVLEKSINTGAVFVQRELGENLFMKYVDLFGFFEKTGIDIQETFSLNSELKKGRDINLATASFGQGIEMTPVQLIKAYSAIANGGKLVTPYLVEEIDGGKEEREEAKQVISSKTAYQLSSMLVSVVEKGFAQTAKIPGYLIAGKTGTAQVSYGSLGIDKKGYSDKTIQTFIGFAPAMNPRFLMLVKLDNPETKTAEYSAVPVFQRLADYIINKYQIPPGL